MSNSAIILLTIGTIINYYTPTPTIGFEFNKSHSVINKLYTSLFFSFIVVLTDVILHRNEYSKNGFIIWILITLIGTCVTYYLIANQIFVDEIEYAYTMKENHIQDLKISENVLTHHTLSNDGINIANNIISNRKKELSDIDNLINKNTT